MNTYALGAMRLQEIIDARKSPRRRRPDGWPPREYRFTGTEEEDTTASE